jgi:hypothetical protein
VVLRLVLILDLGTVGNSILGFGERLCFFVTAFEGTLLLTGRFFCGTWIHVIDEAVHGKRQRQKHASIRVDNDAVDGHS